MSALLASVDAGLSRGLEELRAGRAVVLHDRAVDRADLLVAAELATAEAVAMLTRHGRGVIAVALTVERCAELELPAMCSTVERSPRPVLAFIEARTGVTTGISAADRARTIRVAGSRRYGAADLATPGHVIPLAAAPGALLARRGRVEAAVDAARLAGLDPAAAICEILDEYGDWAGLTRARELARRLGCALIDLDELAEARVAREWEGR